MVRAFLALELSDSVRENLHAVQGILRTCRARMTIVEPENIHITIKFIGEVNEQNLPSLMNAVRTIPFTPFPVSVGSVCVNNPKRPFTVWCPVQDHGRCGELFRLVEDRLAPLGFARETRPFTPHATLARIKDFDPSLFQVLESLNNKEFGECIIHGIKLKKSTLTPRGPVYEDLLEAVW